MVNTTFSPLPSLRVQCYRNFFEFVLKINHCGTLTLSQMTTCFFLFTGQEFLPKWWEMILLEVNGWPHDQILRLCSRNACHCLHSAEDLLARLKLMPYEKFHCKLLVYRINKSVIKNVLTPETWQSNLKEKRNFGLVIFKLHTYKKIKWGLLDVFLLQTVLKADGFNCIENWPSDGLIYS